MDMYQVLLVDDEPTITANMQKAIDWGSLRCQVTGIAESGREALDVIENRPVDIVITDIRMQQMSGLELCQVLYARYPHIQIIVISGYAEFSYVQRAIKYGILGYCLKPLEYEELCMYLGRAVSRLQSREPRYDQDVLLDALSDEDIPLLTDYLKACGNYRDSWYCAVFTGSGPPDIPESAHTLFGMGKRQYGWFSDMPLDRKHIDMFLAGSRNNCVGLTESPCPVEELPRKIKRCQIQALQFFIQPSCTVCTSLPDAGGQAFLNQIAAWLSMNNRSQLLHGMKKLKNSGLRDSFSVQTAMRLNNMICSFDRYRSQGDELYIYSIYQLLERYRDFAELLDRLCQLVIEPEPASGEPLQITNSNFIQMMEYLNQNYTRDISTNDLAEHMHMDSGYLSRIFKRETGTTITRYLTELRIHKSCQMLDSGNYSISETASATGFNDYFYFLKIFKKITGMTPRQYQLGEQRDNPEHIDF